MRTCSQCDDYDDDGNDVHDDGCGDDAATSDGDRVGMIVVVTIGIFVGDGVVADWFDAWGIEEYSRLPTEEKFIRYLEMS